MAVPSWIFFVEPVLKHLAVAKEPQHRGPLLAKVVDSMNLAAENLREMAGSTKVSKASHRAAWALSYASMAGLVEAPRRSYWQLTSSGRDLVAKYPGGIPRSELKKLVKFARRGDPTQEPGVPALSEVTESTPEERLREAHAELLSSVRDQLLTIIRALPPERFESIVLDVLHAAGYGRSREQLRTTTAGADGGIDGVISLDRLGIEKVYVQAKRYAADNAVSRPTIQAFLGALSERRASKGVFITTSRFSKDARECAARSSDSLVLLDGQELAELMTDYGVGVSTRETFRLVTLDTDYFEEQ